MGAKDFRRLHASGESPGASRTIGGAICDARDRVARRLLALGLTPNRVTVIGFLFTLGAAACLLRGAGQQVPYFYTGAGPVGLWPAWAALLLWLAGACDMLDGALARIGSLQSRFGGVLDSALDRFSDIAIFLGCLLYFALLPTPHITGEVLALWTLCNAMLISYVKARAETEIEDCSVGYWLRGERFAAVLIGCMCGHVLAVLWQLAFSSFFTVLRRLQYTYHALLAKDAAAPPPPAGPQPGWRGWFQLWRHPRGSIPYDFVTGTNILYIIVAPWLWPFLLGAGPDSDPLGSWLRP